MLTVKSVLSGTFLCLVFLIIKIVTFGHNVCSVTLFAIKPVLHPLKNEGLPAHHWYDCCLELGHKLYLLSNLYQLISETKAKVEHNFHSNRFHTYIHTICMSNTSYTFNIYNTYDKWFANIYVYIDT